MAELFSVSEAAAIAEVSPETIRTALEKKSVAPSFKRKTGKALRYEFRRRRASHESACRVSVCAEQGRQAVSGEDSVTWRSHCDPLIERGCGPSLSVWADTDFS